MYDIFLVSKGKIDTDRFLRFKSQLPTLQKIEEVKTFTQIKSKSFTKMFWIIWDDLELNLDFDLMSYKSSIWDEQYIHVFKNGNYYDGIALFPKSVEVLQKEFDHRFFTNKKEIDIRASDPIPYDIVFLSFNDINADLKFEFFKKRYPRSIHIRDIKGIHQAHKKSAETITTPMFWVVDSDAEVLPEFDFSFEQIPFYNKKSREILESTVHVYRSRNPLNGLEYGYGGVKLLPRNLMLQLDLDSLDMTTSISDNFKVMDQISNITRFNTDPFNTWKSAFRECVKLSSKIIDRQDNGETEKRLDTWCSVAEGDFAEHCIRGAREGRQFGEQYKNDKNVLKKINDFEWLEERFNGTK
jgi:hypothetical protein